MSRILPHPALPESGSGMGERAWRRLRERLHGALLLRRTRSERLVEPLSDQALGRRRQALLEAMALGIEISVLPWLFYMLWIGQPLLSGFYALTMVLGALQWIAARRGRLHLSAALLCLCAWLAVTGIAIWIDRPTDTLPRTVPLFLMPLFLSQHFLLRGLSAWWRHGASLVTLGLFATLCALPDLASGPAPLGLQERKVGLWMALGTATLLGGWSARLQAADSRALHGLALDLARAIASGGLNLHLQPQCDAQGRVLGAEALVRWQHPRLGPISPARFIPLAEAHELIVPLGEWVLRRAGQLAREWNGHPQLGQVPIAVNVSVDQLRDPAAFERLLDLVRGLGLPAGRLKFELTESVFAERADALQTLLQRCRDHGIGTSLDDFGTGYSSLSYLSRLPFDQLKIDQSFVRKLLDEERDRSIAQTIVQLGQQLGMDVIAEGVETADQLNLLRAMGCQRFQGYWFAKPMPAEAFAAWVTERAA